MFLIFICILPTIFWLLLTSVFPLQSIPPTLADQPSENTALVMPMRCACSKIFNGSHCLLMQMQNPQFKTQRYLQNFLNPTLPVFSSPIALGSFFSLFFLMDYGKRKWNFSAIGSNSKIYPSTIWFNKTARSVQAKTTKLNETNKLTKKKFSENY